MNTGFDLSSEAFLLLPNPIVGRSEDPRDQSQGSTLKPSSTGQTGWLIPPLEKLKPDRLFRPSLNRMWGEMHAEAAAKDAQQEPAVWLGSGAHTPG